MKLLQSLILLFGNVAGVILSDERYTGNEQKRSQTYVKYSNIYLEPALPGKIQDLGGEPGTPNLEKIEEIKAEDGASSAAYGDGDGTNVQTSAIVAGIVVLLWLLWRILPVENDKNASWKTLLKIQRNC